MTDDETVVPKVTGAPERIYINVGDIDEDCDFAELYELLWCTDKIDDADIAYVRADTVDSLIAAAVEAEREAWASGCREDWRPDEIGPRTERNPVMDDEKLLPCPFCGKEPFLTNVRMSDREFYIGCYNELCWRPRTERYGEKHSVIAAWNTRAPLDAIAAAGGGSGLDRSCGKNTPCDLPNIHCQYPKCEYGKNKVGPITPEDAIPEPHGVPPPLPLPAKRFLVHELDGPEPLSLPFFTTDQMHQYGKLYALAVWNDYALNSDNAEALALLKEIRAELNDECTGAFQGFIDRISAYLSKHTQGAPSAGSKE